MPIGIALTLMLRHMDKRKLKRPCSFVGHILQLFRMKFGAQFRKANRV